MGEKIATRNAYGQALAALADKYPELVVFDADLAGATMTKFFKDACPERFFDMGIAECDMVGVAAGMATCGYKPFVNSFAMFSAGRAWEQVRNSVCYPRLNVKVVGSHGGLSVGEDGATHQCIEDFAIMRAIPGMLVLCPCDGNEMRLAVEALVNYEGPAYMRLGRLAVETVTDSIPGYRFELGKGAVLRGGSDVTVIACGIMVQMALEAARQVIGQTPTVDNSALIKQIQQLLQQEPLFSGKPQLRVHPDDLQRVDDMLGATLSLHGWRLRGDPTLHPGGCKVSADEGDLDASVATRWQELCRLAAPGVV